MPTVETELRIAAPPEIVWRTLLQRARWRRYSDFFSLDPSRPLSEGAPFWFGLRLGGLLPTPIRVQVTRRREPEELRWVGHVPGFRGEHYFRLHAEGEGWTHLVHGEHFSGILGELFIRLAAEVIRETYAAFNAGLALQAEGRLSPRH